jgi:hypothetical protein
VGHLVIQEMLAPHLSSGRLSVDVGVRPIAASTDRDRVTSVTLHPVDGTEGDDGMHGDLTVTAAYVIDATETGDLLPLTDTAYVTGFESRAETGEPSAPLESQPLNVQALTYCFAVDHLEGEDHTIGRPARYEHWRGVQPDFWGAPLLSWTAPMPRTLEAAERVFEPNPGDDPHAVVADQSKDPGDGNLWAFRRILAKDLYESDAYDSDICLVNWPSIDYFENQVLEASEAERAERLEDARQLSFSMLYWMQTEAPRPDGGYGWPGLRLRGDVMGGSDGLAQAPYHRESRRIIGLETIREQDVSGALRGDRGARRYEDSVGVGMYRIDLHPSTGGDNYIDVPAEPFEIPLGALIPQRTRNLLPACKNIATTHITNGCYRLHPVEWNIGEVAGLLAIECLARDVAPQTVHADPARARSLQDRLVADGIELHWPDGVHGY